MNAAPQMNLAGTRYIGGLIAADKGEKLASTRRTVAAIFLENFNNARHLPQDLNGKGFTVAGRTLASRLSLAAVEPQLMIKMLECRRQKDFCGIVCRLKQVSP